MALIREIAGKSVNTHYFNRDEVARLMGPNAGPGWYYQESAEPDAPMRGPFRFMHDMVNHIEDGGVR